MIKALGAVVIVLVHAIRPRWDPTISPAELWLGDLTRFAVPGFLAASGYLAATAEAIPRSVTARRLRRILLPYLVASLAAQLYWWAIGLGPLTGSIVTDLLLGASFGAYYFVFVITTLFLVAPLLPRLTPRVLVALFVVLLVGQWILEANVFGPTSLLWEARSPAFWWPYFLAGWLLGLRRPEVTEWVRARRTRIVIPTSALVTAVAVALALLPPGMMRSTIAWIGIWAVLALVGAAACGRPSPPEIIWLSDATYAVFLFHLFFVLPIQAIVPAPANRLDALAVALPWLAGLAGSLLLVAVVGRLMPTVRRDLVGA